MSSSPTRILFLCTGNSCRSQIAEAFAREMGRGAVEVFSAGTDPKPVHPYARRVMADIGMGIADQSSKRVDAFLGQRFDFVITLCNHAKETCPSWPEACEIIAWSIDDPAAVPGPAERQLSAFRDARGDICRRLGQFFDDHAIAARMPSRAH